MENKDEKFVNLIGDLQEQFEREKLGFTLSMNQTKTDLADVRNGLQIFRYFDYKGIGKKKTVELWVGFNTTIWRFGIWVGCHIKPNTPNDIIKKLIRASYYLSYYRQGPSYERTIQKVGRVWLKNLKKSKNGYFGKMVDLKVLEEDDAVTKIANAFKEIGGVLGGRNLQRYIISGNAAT